MALTEEQRAGRENGLFSSDVARIMCGDGVRVALEKLKAIPEEDFEDVAEIKLGNIIEPALLTSYEEQTGSAIERSPECIHPQFSFIGSHPDGLRPDRVVEGKTVGVYNMRMWGNTGTDQVPRYPLWQAVAHMACANLMYCDVPACFLTLEALKYLLLGKTPPVYVFQVPRDFQLEEYMIRKVTNVWECIQAGHTPKPEKHTDIKLIYGQATDEEVEADDATALLWQQLIEEQAVKKASETAEERLKFEIQSYMKDAAVLTRMGRTLATWTNNVDGLQFDEKRFEKEQPDLFKQYLIPRPGPRVFRPKKPKG